MLSVSNASNPFASDASDDLSFPNPATLREVHITDHVPVKLFLAEKNHHAWRTYFYLLFREYNLHAHIDGFVDLFARRDPDWLAIDATIIGWLFLTISPDIFKTVVREGDDAHTVWTKINGLFTDNKLQRIVFLQQEFFGTLQNDQTLDAYCLRLKAISDELHDLGFKIGDEILLSTLTPGLNEDLGNAASNLTLMTKPTFERAVTYLKLEERRLKNLRTRAIHTAFAAGYRAPAPPAPAPPQLAPHPWTAPPLLPTPPSNHNSSRGATTAVVAVVTATTGVGNGGANGGGNGGGNTQPLPPWSGGYNPWTGVIHAYSMPVPRPPAPDIFGPRPPTHQALFAATPPYAFAFTATPPPYAPGYHAATPLYAPQQPAWDPAFFVALQQPPASGPYAGGDAGLWTRAPRLILPLTRLIQNLVYIKTLSRDNSVTVEFDAFGFSVKDARTRKVLH
nr:uncharacterized protein LOC127328870 [Lolium perenne]